MAGFAALDACSGGFQGLGDTGMPYKAENEVWQYPCSSPDAEDLPETFGMFKQEAKLEVHDLYQASCSEQPAAFVTLPESPQSLRSACSQQDVLLKRELLRTTPSSQRSATPLLRHNAPPGAFSLRPEEGPNLCPLSAPDRESDPTDLPELSEGSGSGLHSHVLDGLPSHRLDAVGSSSLSLFHHEVEPTGMETSMAPPSAACEPMTSASLHSTIAGDPSVPLDSSISRSLSESIFEGFSMPDFDETQHQASITPASTAHEEDFDLATLGLAESSLLPPPQMPVDLSACLPEPQTVRSGEEAPRARPRRLASLMKRACEPDTDLDDVEDYEPHPAKRTRPGTKPKRPLKVSSRLDDFIDYQPQERKKAAVTARGRKVNRLQLSEEDNCEEFVETGNRRSKHHNPWTVEETEALVHGVESCGGGKWADIKKLGLRAIEKRSAVDLKDKWRNLQAALHRTKSDKKREIPASLLQRVKVLVPLTATKARGEARLAATRKLARPKAKRQR